MALAVTMSATAENPEKVMLDTLESYQLQSVQVVSTRASGKTPMAFKNFDKEQLKTVNFGQDLPYLLSLTPSVTITSDAGNGIGYTTMRVRGTDPSRINITANGIPMNDAESSSVFWVNMADFASSVQNVQIQRGVGTSTNGAGAFGATVNMLTENIGMKPFVGIDLSAGSYYSHKETLRFGTGLFGGHWGVQGRLSNIGSKGYLDRASTKLNSYFLQGGYFGDNTVVKFITFNGQEETYHAWNYTSKYEQSLYGRRYNSCGLMYADADGKLHYYNNQTDNYHQQNYQLIWNQTINRFFNLNAALHYTKGQGYYEEYKSDKSWADYGLAVNDKSDFITAEGTEYYAKVYGDLVRRKKMDNDFYGAVASLNYDSRKGLAATLGGGWNKYDGDHFGRVIWEGTPYKYYKDADGSKYKDANGNKTFAYTETASRTADFEYYRNRAKKTDFNIYGKVRYDFFKGFNGYVDLQYRHVGYKMQDPADWFGANTDGKYVIDESFNFFNPKFGLNYEITPNHRVYASYAIAHKEPVRNNYENCYNAGMDMPRAERLNDLEVGYNYHSRTFSAGVNVYWMNYKDQFVLTGEIDNIGEAVTRNLDKSYRLGVELEAAWKPVDWFRWDINATFSKNRVKDMTVVLEDYSTVVNLGEQPLAFSPDLIFNNIFTFSYCGFKASVQSQYVGDQYLTNTGFKTMMCEDENGDTTWETLQLKNHFVTNVDLSYNFSLRKFGIKDATVGVTLYNLFSAKYDNNGWAAPQYRQDTNGTVTAVNTWGVRDCDAAGFAVSAPFNFMAHLSLNF